MDTAVEDPPLGAEDRQSQQRQQRYQIAIVGDAMAGGRGGIGQDRQSSVRRDVGLAGAAQIGGKRVAVAFAGRGVETDQVRLGKGCAAALTDGHLALRAVQSRYRQRAGFRGSGA